MSTRARATSMRAIRHGARKLTARARAVRALLSTGTKGRIPALWSDAGWFRDRARTQPWVYPQDLEQQVQWVDDLTGQPRGWALGPDLLNGAGSFASTAGWSLTGTGASQSVSGGVLTVTRGSTTTYTTATITTVVGRRYYVTLRVEGFTQNPVFRVSTTLGGTENANVTYTTVGTRSVDFVATSATTYISLYAPGAATDTTRWSGVTVQEVTLDQSWLGPELVTNGGFGTDTWWTKQDGTITISGGAANFSGTPDAVALYVSTSTLGTLAGRAYAVTYTVTSYTAGGIRFGIGAVYGATRTAAGTYTEVITPGAGGFAGLYAVGTTTLSIDNVSVREIPGNPSVSPSAGNGPTATARVNLLQRTQEFDNAAWNKGTGSISADSVVAPNGTMTADAYTWGTTTSFAFLSQTVAGLPQLPQRFTIYLKVPVGVGSKQLRLVISDVTTSTGTSDVTVTESWQPFTFTRTSANSTGQIGVGLVGALGSPANGIAAGDVLHVWGADLRLAVYDSLNLPAYQRVGDGSAGVFDYDWQGFPVRLVRGAANRGLMTLGTLDLTGTDAVNAGMWVVKTSDAATAMILELSPTVSGNNGAFYFVGPSGASAATYQIVSKGTLGPSSTTPGSFPAPHMAAALFSAKISTDTMSLALNGTVATSNTADQGTGNYGNHRLYEGGRSLDSSPSLSFTGEWLPGFVVDANGVPADLAAEVLREYAAAVNFYY